MNTTKIWTGVFALLVAGSVNAMPIQLSLLGPGDMGWQSIQQNDQGPCVIGDPSCGSNQNGLPYTLLPAGGNVGSYSEMSPIYTVGEVTAIAGNVFSIGVDINNAPGQGDSHILDLFSATVNGVTEFIYDGGAILSQNITNSGNGFSDYVLASFDLSSFDPSDELKFFLELDDVNGGRDQFFLIAGDDDDDGGDGDDDDGGDDGGVPEPGPLALLGLGLLMMGARRFRRK